MAKLGRKWAAPGVVLQCAPRPADVPAGTCPRVGFTASRKVGPSVARNRARRRLRAAVAKILPLHARPGYDLVLIARKGTLTRPFAKLLGDLEASLKKLDVYCNQAGNKEAL